MLKVPNAIGLTLCQQVVVEEETKNLTLVNCFHRLVVDEFDSSVPPFFVVIALTDGLGAGELRVEIMHLAEQEVVYDRIWPITLDDSLRTYRLTLRIGECSFSSSGLHQVSIFLDDELIALTLMRVHRKER